MKYFLIAMVFISAMMFYSSAPQIKVKNGMVVEVDGKPVYRPLGKWDILEAEIQD